MGFISAVKELGEFDNSEVENSDGLGSFLQLPLPIIEDEARRPKVIRLWLNANVLNESTLDIKGVSKIDLVDYMAGDGDVETQKRRYLYRDPVGSAAKWRFSPVYKLGKGSSKAEKELAGEADDEGHFAWRENSDCRFYKLQEGTLLDYEKRQVFSSGSVDRIMKGLEESIESIFEKWSDKNRSYLMVFGLDDKGRFLYPGQIEPFVNYFKSKLKSSMKGGCEVICALCGDHSSSGVNLDKIFSFATFDKISFLPGVTKSKGTKEKVFPICQKCFSSLSNGRDILDRRFLDGRTIPGIKIYVVPELIFGIEKLDRFSSHSEDFIRQGIKVEDKLFKRLAKQDNSIVFHFLFWESNQAQERVHLMVEDVPPSRLNRLQSLWQTSYKNFLWNREKEPDLDIKDITLDDGIKNIYQMLSSLSGKNEQDKSVMLDMTIGLVGKLLGGEKVDVMGLKKLMVSRLYGLCSDDKWLKYGSRELRRMTCITDFMIRANGGGPVEL